MDNKERVRIIQKARETILQIESDLSEIVAMTMVEANYFAYGQYGITQLLNQGNPYDHGLDDLEEHFKKRILKSNK